MHIPLKNSMDLSLCQLHFYSQIHHTHTSYSCVLLACYLDLVSISPSSHLRNTQSQRHPPPILPLPHLAYLQVLLDYLDTTLGTHCQCQTYAQILWLPFIKFQFLSWNFQPPLLSLAPCLPKYRALGNEFVSPILQFCHFLTESIITHTSAPPLKCTFLSVQWPNTFLHHLCTLRPATWNKGFLASMAMLGFPP